MGVRAALRRRRGPRLPKSRMHAGDLVSIGLVGLASRRVRSTLTAAGIPILAALRVTKGTLGNRAMERVIDEVAEQVTAGKTIAEPMEKSGYFPPMLVQVVNLGERSGKLDQMLGNAAKAFEERTEQSVKLFTTALPPVLVVGLACVVGFIVMAILLALLQVQDAAVMG